ncbi:MAG TPA: right-handed parallel beta-helix repeat-containing protein [Candidatus Dormibacteraeota bacterium]|nr:right-handed parallel beta-helix repeat-containing protein [Candidatus Dormibacteraeota bacterium]
MRKHIFGAATAVALLASVPATARVVEAAPVGCGSVITASTTLTADVGPCNQGGLVVQGSGVVLDLGGHTVMGKARVGDGVGVLLQGATGSTVRNGTVTGFDAGVEVLGGGSNTVTAITAKGNIGGVRSDRDLGDGITIQQSNGNVVTANVVTGNGPFSGISIVDIASNPSLGSAGNVISANRVVNNNVVASGAMVDQDDGIRIEGPNATNTTITGNTVMQSGLDGIAVFADQGTGFANTGTTITSNTVAGNGFHQFAHRKGDGVILFGAPGSTTVRGADGTLVQGNTVQGNAANGVRVAARSNTINGNTATGNDAFPGVTAYDLADTNTTPPCDGNVWSADTFGTRNQACVG